VNVVLTRQDTEIPDVVICHSPEEAVALAKTAGRAMVIGGGSIYKQLLPHCDTAYITKVHVTPESDTFFPNLDADPEWELESVLQSGKEDDIAYEMCLYKRKGTA
jgi:dihydrofolate reductase